MLKGIKSITALLCLLSLNLSAGSILKCQASDGSITFADTRCPSGQTLLSLKKHQARIKSPPVSIKNIEHISEFPSTEKLSPVAKNVFQSKFVQALSSLTMIKISMAEHYMVQGQWPASLDEMGYETNDMTSSLIKKTQVSELGRLQVLLVDDFGEAKQIWIYPRPVMGGTQIEWVCYSNFPSYDLKTTTGESLCKSRYF